MRVIPALLLILLTALPAQAQAWRTFNRAQESFGGSGKDGAVTKGAVTETQQLQLNATVFTQSASTTWVIGSGTVLNATATVNLNGATSCKGNDASLGGFAGGSATTSNRVWTPSGAGPGGGHGSIKNGTIDYGGGGGAGQQQGGSGGSTSSGDFVPGGMGSNGYYGATLLPGSGGGGAEGDGTNAGGVGGNGGGILIVCARGAITTGAGSSIDMRGGPGGNGQGATNASGGGGGGGGGFRFYSRTSITMAASSGLVSGGAGGNAASTSGGAGGGGGGGSYLLVSPSNSAANTTAAGGAAGTGSASQAASAGNSGGGQSITTEPTLPLLALHCDDAGLWSQWHIARAKTILAGRLDYRDQFNYVQQGRQHCEFLAAWYAKPGSFEDLRHALLYGGDVGVSKLCAARERLVPSFKFASGTILNTDKPSHPSRVAVGDFITRRDAA